MTFPQFRTRDAGDAGSREREAGADALLRQRVDDFKSKLRREIERAREAEQDDRLAPS